MYERTKNEYSRPKLLVGVDASKNEHAYGPQLIAGGRAVLFTLHTGDQAWDESLVVVHELSTGRRTTVVSGGADARVLPTGHLAYVRDETLFAMSFDEERMAVTGGPVPLLPGIQVSTGGAAQVALSASGAMAAMGSGPPDRSLAGPNAQGQRGPRAGEGAVGTAPPGSYRLPITPVGVGRVPARRKPAACA